MAFNFSGLAKSISGAIDSVTSLFTPAQGEYAPTYDAVGVTNKVDRANWVKSLPYEFRVVNSKNEDVAGFKSIPLPIAPSDITQDEMPSIKVKATQNGSVTNHGGIRFRDLVIKGTTGVFPNKGFGGATTGGRAPLRPTSLEYRSGYESFQILRNYFRAYYHFKKSGTPTAKDARLIFRNFKDGEDLVVELLKFSMVRSSTKPFMYDYALNFRVVGPAAELSAGDSLDIFQQIDKALNTGLEAIETARSTFLAATDILKQIESTYEQALMEPLRKAALAIKAFRGLSTSLADLGPNLSATTLSAGDMLAVLTQGGSPGERGDSQKTSRAAIKALGPKQLEIDYSQLPRSAQLALQKELVAASNIPREVFEEAIVEITRIRDNAADKFNLGDDTYNEQSDRISTVEVDSDKTPTDSEFLLLAGFSQAIQGLTAILSSRELFPISFNAIIEDINEEFNDALGLQVPEAVKELILPASMDLERLALQELGDSRRWIEIAELNRLKPPYIIQDISDTTENVVHPGERILIPQPIVNGFGETVTLKERFINKNMSALERNLGIDVKLTDDFDFDMSNVNDVNLVRGKDNAAQAIGLKIAYEKGDLVKHPTLGVGIEIGKKGLTVNEIRDRMVQSFSQDPRFDKITNLLVQRENNVLEMTFEVLFKNVDVPIPLTLRL